MEQSAKETLNELLQLLARTQKDIENLNGLSEQVVQEAKNNLFRAFHTIKGGVGLQGWSEIGQLAGQLESLCHYLRLGQIIVSAELISLVSDCLGELQKSLASEIPEQLGRIGNLADLSCQIEQLLSRKISVELTAEAQAQLLTKANIDPAIVATFTDYEETRLFEILKSNKGLRKIRVVCNLADIGDDKLPQVQQMIRDRKLGEIIATFPDNEQFTDSEMVFWIFLGSSLLEELILETLAKFQVTIEQDLSFTDDDLPWGLE